MSEYVGFHKYRCLIHELLYGFKYMSECEYNKMIKGVKQWYTRECIAELKDIADSNID